MQQPGVSGQIRELDEALGIEPGSESYDIWCGSSGPLGGGSGVCYFRDQTGYTLTGRVATGKPAAPNVSAIALLVSKYTCQ